MDGVSLKISCSPSWIYPLGLCTLWAAPVTDRFSPKDSMCVLWIFIPLLSFSFEGQPSVPAHKTLFFLSYEKSGSKFPSFRPPTHCRAPFQTSNHLFVGPVVRRPTFQSLFAFKCSPTDLTNFPPHRGLSPAAAQAGDSPPPP